jgi:hypothetical protein
MVVQAVVIGAMGAWLHPVVLGVLVLRSVPGSIAAPVQLGVILPRLEGRLRATYLSVQSLMGRLAFSFALLLAARAVGGLERLDHAAMTTLSVGFGIAMGVVALVLLPWVGVLRRPLSREI